MWTDMQKALGDKPSLSKRIEFKFRWCREHFPGERIASSCFLCEYALDCDFCPIKWDKNDDYDSCVGHGVSYERSPISVILAMPEREVEDGQSC
jgi:hypothetical protein